MKNFLLCLSIAFFYGNIHGQNDVLYIGNNLAIKSGNSFQTSQIDSFMFKGKSDAQKIVKSVAFVTDELGNIMAYTDGQNLFDANHKAVGNESQLNKFEHCLFVRNPKTNDSYYFCKNLAINNSV